MYISKDYWMICDMCGHSYRRSEMKKEWNNLWVCTRGCWEPRHPQDFVKAKKDKQSVEVARPDTTYNLRKTTLKVAASKDDITIDVNSISGILDKSAIGIELDDDTTFQTYVNGTPSGDTVTLGNALWGDAALGNDVYVYAVTGDNFLTTDITQDDL